MRTLISSVKIRKFISYLEGEATKMAEKEREACEAGGATLAARYYGESLGIIWTATELEKLITEQE